MRRPMHAYLSFMRVLATSLDAKQHSQKKLIGFDVVVSDEFGIFGIFSCQESFELIL